MQHDEVQNSVEIFAPAKVNIRLKVVGRRDNGYHVLSMLNAPVTLGDDVSVRLVGPSAPPQVTLQIAGERAVDAPRRPEDNLAGRAAQLFAGEFDIQKNIHIHLYKRIPAGAGLAGGSSDAAAVLRGLAQICGLRNRDVGVQASIMRLALRLGADVPFLLSPQVARVTGIGEHISPFPSAVLDNREMAILVPPCVVSTKEVYSRYALCSRPNGEKQEDSALSEACSRAQAAGCQMDLAEIVENDLEQAASKVEPKIATLLAEFRAIPESIVWMTGSGCGCCVTHKRVKQFAKPFYEVLQCMAESHGAQLYRVRILANSRVSDTVM